MRGVGASQRDWNHTMRRPREEQKGKTQVTHNSVTSSITMSRSKVSNRKTASARTGILTDVVIETQQGSGEFYTFLSIWLKSYIKALNDTDLYHPSWQPKFGSRHTYQWALPNELVGVVTSTVMKHEPRGRSWEAIASNNNQDNLTKIFDQFQSPKPRRFRLGRVDIEKDVIVCPSEADVPFRCTRRNLV